MLKSLMENLLRFLTGTKTPTKSRLIWTVVFLVLFFIISTAVGFYLADLYGEWTAEPNVEVVMPFDLEEDFLPIQVKNIGEKTLTNISVLISSCDMNYNMSFYLPDLEPTVDYIIKFKEKATIGNYSKLDCLYYDINYTDYGEWIEIYKDQETGQFIIPAQEIYIDQCGYCFWDIQVNSNELNKDFREHTYSTIQLVLSTEGQNPEDFKDNLTKAPIRLSFFDDRMVKALSKG